MKKLMMLSLFFATAVVFVGCKKAPKVPEDTLVAVYVDIPQSVENIGEFLSAAAEQLSESKCRKANKSFEKIYSVIKKDFKAFDPEWMVAVLCGDKENSPRRAVIIKCNYEAEIPSLDDESLEERYDSEYKDRIDEGGACNVGKTKINTEKVYVIDGEAITFIDGKDGKYVIMCEWDTSAAYEYYRETRDRYYYWEPRKTFDSDEYNRKLCDSDERGKKMLSNLIDIYRDGEGDVSEDFDDLNKLDGNAIARVKTAKLGTLRDLENRDYGFLNCCMEFAEKSGDEKFVEDVDGAKGYICDFILSGDEVGVRLEIDAGSKELAKAFEGSMYGSAISGFFFGNVFSRIPTFGDLNYLTSSIRRLEREFMSTEDDSSYSKSVAKLLREGTEIDRTGSSVSAERVVDTDSLLAEIMPDYKDEFNEKIDELTEEESVEEPHYPLFRKISDFMGIEKSRKEYY